MPYSIPSNTCPNCGKMFDYSIDNDTKWYLQLPPLLLYSKYRIDRKGGKLMDRDKLKGLIKHLMKDTAQRITNLLWGAAGALLITILLR